MSSNTDDTRSAAVTSEEELTEERFLEAYKKKEYPKPSLTADIAVFRRSAGGVEVLLIRRGKHPYKDCWALPGGFVGQNEDVIDAARRELEEETGVAGAAIELFGIYGTPGRDPRGWTVSGGFCALMGDDVLVEAGDDAADARWCELSESVDALQPDSGDEGVASDVEPAHVLKVTCGADETLIARFEVVEQRFGAPRAHVVESDGFAFDHAQLLADAYLKVATQLVE